MAKSQAEAFDGEPIPVSHDLQRNGQRFPLLQPQQPVWFGHTIGNSKSAYNIGQYTEFSQSPDITLFRTAAEHVVRNTDSLRLRFRSNGETVWQEIAPPEADPVSVIDLSDEPSPRARALEFVEAAIRRPFQLDQEPPFRWYLVHAQVDCWLWCQVYHHAALDAQSAWLVSARVAGAYTDLCRTGKLCLDPDGALAALAREEKIYRESGRLADDKSYWTSLLSDCERMRSWTSKPPLQGPDVAAIRETAYLSDETSVGIRLLAQDAGVGSGHLLIAAAALVQTMHQREQDIVLGVPLLGRSARSVRSYPSMTSNEGHLRLCVSPDCTFRELASQVARRMRLAVRHQCYPYEILRADLGLRGGDPDLFSISVNIMPFVSELEFNDLETRSHYVSYGPVRDLSLSLFDHPVHNGLRIDLDGNGKLHARSDISRHLRTVLSILQQAVHNNGQAPVCSFMLAAHASRSLESRPIETQLAADLPSLIAKGIGDGTAVAVTDGTCIMTRAELETRSNALARLLIQRGAGPEAVVAIASERNPGLVVAVLAVLKAGAACMLLDPRNPVARLKDLLRSGNATHIVRAGTFGDALDDEVPTIIYDAIHAELAGVSDRDLAEGERRRQLHPQNLAFVVHTSGSTGRPKCIGLTHANIVNKLSDQIKLWEVGPSSRFALSSSLSFDPSIHQLLLPLAAGGTCVLAAPEDMNDVEAFWSRIVEAGVTHLDVVPTFAEVLKTHALQRAPELRVFILGGEELQPQLLRDLMQVQPQSRFFNMYGPTETCIDATAMDLSGQAVLDSVPIGSPLSNYRIHVLDTCLRPLPELVTGEIYISGSGVTRGYLGRPDLTAERYIAYPFGDPGERMYRTGDLGRWRADGTLEFIGRMDDQIKVRGVRIEPAEVEAALRAQPGVHQAVVDARGTSEHRMLVGYVSRLPGTVLDGAQLRASISSVLPSHATPAAVMVLDALPLMTNGKLDRRALPDPVLSPTSMYVPPASSLEARLCKGFGIVTSCPDVSVLDNFFALGGNSLLAMKLVTLLKNEDDIHVPLRSVFVYPTPRVMAAALNKSTFSSEPYDPILILREGGEFKPLFCVHAASGYATVYRAMVEKLDPNIPVYGFEARDEPPETITEMARSYVEAMLRVQSQGPYYLLGWSFGGVIAHEMARQLELQGESVGLLLLVDSYFRDIEADGGTDAWKRDIAEMFRSNDDTDEAPAVAKSLLEGPSHTQPWAERMKASAERSGHLIAKHRAGCVDAPTLFLRASDNIDARLGETLSAIASRPVQIEDFAAGHYSLFDTEHVSDLAAFVDRQLVSALRK